MRFEEFLMTGEYHEDLRPLVPGLDDGQWEDTPVAGMVYHNGLYIEKTERGWCLTLCNQQLVQSFPTERPNLQLVFELYRWGLSEELVMPDPQINWH